MKLDMEYKDGILFVRLNGSLTKNHRFRINNYLVSVLKKHKIKYLVCNLKEINDIDIMGIESLLNLKCVMKTNKGKMLLCGLHSRIAQYLKPLKIPRIENELLAVEYLGA